MTSADDDKTHTHTTKIAKVHIFESEIIQD